MLKQHHQLFQGLFFFSDMIVVSAAWVLAYFLRFEWGPIPAPKGTPPMANYLPMVLFVWIIWGVTLRLFGLYHVTRGTQAMHEVIRVAQASTLSVLVFMAVAFLFWEKNYSFSRGVFFYFWVLAVVMLVAERILLRQVLTIFRARGYNQRHVLIIGSGELAQSVARKIAEHPGLGFRIRGFLAERAEEIGRAIDGARVVGTYADVQSILEQNGIDQVLIALPLDSIGYPRGDPQTHRSVDGRHQGDSRHLQVHQSARRHRRLRRHAGDQPARHAARRLERRSQARAST